MRNYYVPGSWNAICDRCGFKFKSHMLLKEWTGLQVCHECWEPRHPQTLIRIPEDRISTPWTRPEAENVFINVGEVILTEGEVMITTETLSVLLTET